jgi:DNA helicase-2/ATP-dependent DNA helicase PcrA
MKAFAVYGPPGCGKTTEMLRRVEEASQRVSKTQIVFLSFTKAGAAEALKRLNLTRSDKICTIHSLMFRLTNCSSPAVVDGYKLKQFGALTGFKFKGVSNDTAELMETGDQYISLLSKAKNTMRALQEEYYESDRPGNWEEFQFFVQTYTDWKRENGYVDFNDMLEMYLKRPVNHGGRVIFVDEAQDLSNLQWAIIDRMLEFPQVEEVHIAGDDDQAIYEWSGANTHGMAEFEDRYGAERVVLDQSWRVPAVVHELALDVVHRISNRVEKAYKPRAELGRIRRFGRFDAKNVKHGDDVLILCRNYVTREEIETELIRQRIPYSNDGGLPGLYSSRTADAIRVFHKLAAGESVSAAQLEKLALVADDRTKREIAAKDFKPMLQRGYMRSLAIRRDQVEFYRDADVRDEPTIRLSTIHSAKGREADHVVLHTGLTMKTLNDMDRNFDAEARVWYVGVTRARHSLDILEGDRGFDLG